MFFRPDYDSIRVMVNIVPGSNDQWALIVRKKVFNYNKKDNYKIQTIKTLTGTFKEVEIEYSHWVKLVTSFFGAPEEKEENNDWINPIGISGVGSVFRNNSA